MTMLDHHRAPARAGATAGFADLGVPAPIARALADGGITDPFPIQVLTLPPGLAGRDVLARGMTGSGKTIAFAVPVVARIAALGGRTRAGRPRGLVLVPTRELATQVAAVIAPLAAAVRLRCTTVHGGVGPGRQVADLRAGADIVVACPGRLEDLIGQGACSLTDVHVTVLDEADHMADLGFLPAVRRLLDATPAGGQRLLFSATIDRGIDALIQRYTSDLVVHELGGEPSPRALEHHLLALATADKPAVVHELAASGRRLVLFVRTKHGAKKLARQLSAKGVDAHELHGNLSQPARDRNLAAFAAGDASVLVATDVAARGIHVDGIDMVVHVDPPADHKAYLHRSGRTARAGASGVVATLVTPEQATEVRRLARAAGITPTTTPVRPGHPLLRTLGTGGAPAPVAASAAIAPGPGARTIGTIKFFHRARGFGFIARDDGDDVYVHASQVSAKHLADGQRVTFSVHPTERGHEARHVAVA